MTKAKSFQVRELAPLDMEVEGEIKKAIDFIRDARRILISSTLTSDGDSIGSQIGLLHLIRSLKQDENYEVIIVNESPVPGRYRFLPDTDQILSFKEYSSLKDNKSFDLGFVCDGGIERTGVVAPLFESIPRNVLVDHHAIGSQAEYAAKALDLKASSTCEIVFNFFEIANTPLTQAVASHLYVGIVFDTGFFKHSLTTPRTHYVAAELIRTGIDFSYLSDRALLERTWTAQLLLKKLLENMRRSSDAKIVISSWSRQEMDEINFQDGDQEGMINQLYYTEGAEVVALFTEVGKNQIKVSFRSKGALNVAEFARRLDPMGGGHARAAGCSLSGSLEEVSQRVFEELQKLV